MNTRKEVIKFRFKFSGLKRTFGCKKEEVRSREGNDREYCRGFFSNI
jgi:hypothetical protein